MEKFKRVAYELNGNENDFIELLEMQSIEYEVYQGALNDAVFVDAGYEKDGEIYKRMVLLPEFRNSQSNDLIIHLTNCVEWYDRIKKEWSKEIE